MVSEGVWRHATQLPNVAPEHRISLGEGETPLVPLPRWGAAHGLRRVFAKLEYTNPTGSFKDRGMAVLVSLAKQSGAKHLVEDSSGNAGASAAAYAARAGLSCTVYAPESAPPAKLRQIRAYGAEIILVPGPRQAATDDAARAGTAPGTYRVNHTENDAFLPGNKTLAYELLNSRDALGVAQASAWHLVAPAGGGALVLGAWHGFLDALEHSHSLPIIRSLTPPLLVAFGQDETSECARRRRGSAEGGASECANRRGPDPGPLGTRPLEAEGQGEVGGEAEHTSASPRLHACQTAMCDPLARAFAAGLTEPASVAAQPSICGGILLPRPPKGAAILEAIRQSGGSAISSAEAQILAEHQRLAHLEGIYCEPTSAAALAGLAQLAAQRVIAPDEVVVIAITGSGLKDPGPTAT